MLLKRFVSEKPTVKIQIVLESESLAFMGTNVISGRATALVLVVGDETMMGKLLSKPSTPMTNQPHLREK